MSHLGWLARETTPTADGGGEALRHPSLQEVPRMLLVTTIGGGSMDIYAQHLGEHLPVPKLFTDVYQQVAELFNVPLLSRTAARAAWQDAGFIRTLRQVREPLHLPNHHLGRYGRFLSVPYVVTVHDLIRYFDLKGWGPFIHRPNLRDRLYLQLDYVGIRRAAAIIAVSQTTKRDLVRYLGIPKERIFVIYEGIDHTRFRPVARRIVDGPYILFVGSEHPRKNLITLLRAFRLLKDQACFRDLKLVKVGAAGGREAPFRQRTLTAIAALGLEREVLLTGHVPSDDLVAYYSGAACLVLPSLYEGFGFPPLEAMACGCPVIVANAGALPEIAGDAALIVNARDVQALAGAVRDVLVDEQTRQDLIRRGFQRSCEFSWERTARETLTVYQVVEQMSPSRSRSA
jgi:glycosyltransferase involved in cell wall biosynthesis